MVTLRAKVKIGARVKVTNVKGYGYGFSKEKKMFLLGLM